MCSGSNLSLSKCSRLLLVIVYTVSLTSVVCCQEGELGEVVFVNVLHRHGDRSPLDLYRTDPYQNNSYWPDGFGQLSKLGKRQLYELGQWLRQRYDKLLTERYSRDIIYYQSTDIDRTLMSAESNLAGMFPPRGSQVWNYNLAWQPIPVHTIPIKFDKVLAQKVKCPTYDEELERVFTTDEKVKQLNETYSELFQWMSENSGENISLKNVDWVRDTLFVERAHNLTLPQWTKTVFPQPMEEASMYSFMLETWTPTLARLKTGLLLGEMIKNMEKKVNKKITRNVHVYSAHDENIANLLNALGAFNYAIPPYASCLMMELRVDIAGNHFVTLYLRNSTTAEPYLLKVAGCDSACLLKDFIARSKPLIPEDWNVECGLKVVAHSHALTTIIVVIVVVVVIVIIVIILWSCCKKKKKY